MLGIARALSKVLIAVFAEANLRFTKERNYVPLLKLSSASKPNFCVFMAAIVFDIYIYIYIYIYTRESQMKTLKMR